MVGAIEQRGGVETGDGLVNKLTGATVQLGKLFDEQIGAQRAIGAFVQQQHLD